MVRNVAAAGLVACGLLVARPAGAFLVVGTEAGQGVGPQTRIVALREDARSVVAVAPSVRGPARPLAIVIPLQAAAASTLRTVPITLLERTDKLAAPRVDELWELDPCELHPNQQAAPPATAAASAGASASAGPSAAGTASASASAAATAGAIVDGNYEITVLSAEDSASAAKWLTDRGYKLPEGAESALGAMPSGTIVAVARIDGARLSFDKDVARLPPLAFVVNGAVSLPLRLAGLGAAGPHDVIVDVLSPHARFEASNAINIAVPTNLDAKDEARADIDGLYRAIVDFTFEKTPGAALTEYAWLAASCDGCPDGSAFGAEDLLALGADRLPSAENGTQREVLVDAPEGLSRAPEGPPELKRSILACYEKTLGEMRGLAGEATVMVQTGAGGAVKSATIKEASAEALGKCVADAARAVKFDKADATGAIKAKFSLVARAYLSQMVLTRLRLRTTKGAGADLELRGAAAIEGGREEGPTGQAEKKVYFAEHSNNFRARYVVRHAWPGAIACEEPKRGVWGAKPKNLPPSSDKPAASSSSSARASASATASAAASGKPAAPSAAERLLSSLLEGGALPDLQAYAITFRAAQPATPAPPVTAPAPGSATPPPAASTAGQTGASGCGCQLEPAPVAGPVWLAIGAIAALFRRNRRRIR